MPPAKPADHLDALVPRVRPPDSPGRRLDIPDTSPIPAPRRCLPAPALARPRVYEHLITEELARALDAATGLEQLIATVDDEEAPAALARHLARELERGLASLPAAARAEHARALTAKLLDVLADALEPADAELVRDQRPTEPARRLLALHRGAAPVRPSTPDKALGPGPGG